MVLVEGEGARGDRGEKGAAEKGATKGSGSRRKLTSIKLSLPIKSRNHQSHPLHLFSSLSP